MARGRPTTVTEEARTKYLSALKLGSFKETAAQSAGVTLRAVQRFLASNRKDAKEFRRQCEEAESGVELRLVGMQYSAALTGDLKAGRWLLSIRKPHLYGQQRELLREVRRVIAKLEKERAQLRREVLRLRGAPAGGSGERADG